MGEVKRFLVFGNVQMYPAGGWDDLISKCDTLEGSKLAAHEDLKENFCLGVWAHVVDTTTGERWDGCADVTDEALEWYKP
jgi:hypothetical protein